MTRHLIILLFFLFSNILKTQSNLFLLYPNAHPIAPDRYFSCNFYNIVKTADKGYVLSYNPYAPNVHGPNPVDYITIKTDSNFVPKWKKPHCYMSLALPTGGIILINSLEYDAYYTQGYVATVEKVTASGQLIWQKKFGKGYPDMVNISDALAYGNKITLAGYHSYDASPFPTGSFKQSAIFTLDTSGNVLYKSEFVSNNYNYDSFNKIIRDAAGNFIVAGEKSGLSKFDPTMNLLWSKSWSSAYAPTLSDIKLLSNGDMFCSGHLLDTTNAYYTGAFYKFSSTGSMILEKRFPSDTNNYVMTLEKLPNGNFVVNHVYSIQTFADSTSIVSIDSNATIQWWKKYQQALSAGPGKLIKNKVYFPAYTTEPAVFSINADGSSSCGSKPFSRPLLTGFHSQVTNPLIIIQSTVVISSSSLSPGIQTQSYSNYCGSSVGITEFSGITEEIVLYPNPAQNILHLHFTENGIKSFVIWSNQGEKLKRGTLIFDGTEAFIKTEDLPNGIYFLQLESLNNVTTNKRFVIAR